MAFQREGKFITFMETHSGTEKQKINPDTIEHNTVTCMADRYLHYSVPVSLRSKVRI